MNFILELVAIDWLFWTSVSVALLIAGIVNEDSFFIKLFLSALIIVLGGMKFGITVTDLKSSPLFLAEILGAYFAVGVIWSFFRWYALNRKIISVYEQEKSDYIAKNNPPKDFLKTPLDTTNVEAWAKANKDFFFFLRNRGFTDRLPHTCDIFAFVDFDKLAVNPSYIWNVLKPHSYNFARHITSWITFWPQSVVWFVLSEPVRDIADYIYSRVKGSFQRMSDAMFDKTEA